MNGHVAGALAACFVLLCGRAECADATRPLGAPAVGPGGVLSLQCGDAADVTAQIQGAVDSSAASGVHLHIIAGKGACVISKAVKVHSDAYILGINKPIIRSSNPGVSTIFDVSNSSHVFIGGLTLDGDDLRVGYTVTQPTILMSATKDSTIQDLVIQNTVRDGIRLSSGATGNTISKVTVQNGGGYNGLTLDGASHNEVHDFGANGHFLWTVGIVGNSSYNNIVRPWSYDSGAELVGLQYPASHNAIIDPHTFLAPYPKWMPGSMIALGQRVISTGEDGRLKIYYALTGGRSGGSPPACIGKLMTIPATVKCSDGGVEWAFWREFNSAGDNCISLTGSYNSVSGGNLTYCKRNGIALYGDNNKVTGVSLMNDGQGFANPGRQIYSCIYIGSNFGGIATNNSVSDNICSDNQAKPTAYYGVTVDKPYQAWRARAKYDAAAYVVNGHRLYMAKSGGVSGDSGPNCGSGDCSDGSMAWTAVRTYEVSGALHNQVDKNRVGATASGKSMNVDAGQHNDGNVN